MSYRDVQARRRALERARRARLRRRRLGAVFLLLGFAFAAAAVAISGGDGSSHRGRVASSPGQPGRGASGRGRFRAAGGGGRATGIPGHAVAPILMYHVINPPTRDAPFPGLYVPRAQFAAQMEALKAAGWHAVTLNQLEANWTRGLPLGPGRPIVISFDNGYQSQYTNALPVLQRLGWKGVENIQLTGLPPSQGGLSRSQIRGLLQDGWELDTQGISHADLITLNAGQLRYQVATARAILRRRYGVPVNWFCYPSGHYNATVIAAVRAAGFEGSTTVVPGWAARSVDPYRLPRLRVLGGTSPDALLSQISGAEHATAPPPAYS